MIVAETAHPGDHSAGQSESEWLTLARQGDSFAWERIIRNHQDHVFRLAYLIVRDPAEAEDVAQETFVRAFLALNDFETGRALRPWLIRIAVNLARNRRRSLNRYLNHLGRLFKDRSETESNMTGAEGAVEAQWLASRLWTAVRQVSDKGEEVIYLRYFLGMSEAEMAESLDVPPGTVKSRLNRAQKQLRGIIVKDFPELQELVTEE